MVTQYIKKGAINIIKCTAHVFVESLLRLKKYLDPNSIPRFTELHNLPDIILNEHFEQRLLAAEAALKADQFIQALEDGHEAVSILTSIIAEAANLTQDEPDYDARLEFLVQRVFLPSLLDVIERDCEFLYHFLVGILFLEERMQEWVSDELISHRVVALSCEAVAKLGRKTGDSESDSKVISEWPNIVIDIIAIAFFIISKTNKSDFFKNHPTFQPLAENPRYDFWISYGWESAANIAFPFSEELAQRTVTTWWDYNPGIDPVEENYQVKPADTTVQRLGVTWIPLLEKDSGISAVLPIPHGAWSGIKHKISPDWQIELTRFETNYLSGNVEFKCFYKNKDDEPLFDIGNADEPGDGVSLAVTKVEVIGSAQYNSLKSELCDVKIVAKLKEVEFSLGTPPIDLFRRALPNGVGGTFNIGIGYGIQSGAFIEGGLGMDVYAPLNWETPSLFGFSVEIPHLRFAIAGKHTEEESNVTANVRIGLNIRFGPLKLITDNIGLEAALEYRPKNDGNLSCFNITWDEVFPDSFGLELSAGWAQGKGYISHEKELDRWSGVWSVSFSKFNLNGLIIYEKGSFLGLAWLNKLSIPFLSGTITGLGAIFGSDRHGDREAFLKGLKNGVLDAILFPDDLVTQAPQLVATASQFFPRATGYTLVGIMAQWVFGGSSRIFVVELAIILEFLKKSLERVYIIGQGQIRVKQLPEKLLSINIESYGEFDFEKDEYFLKATLRNSKLAGGDLSGDGLIYYNSDTGFILSLGGFNPRYTVPQVLPRVERIKANLIDSEHLRLLFEAYFAITPSSIQVGGQIYLWVGAGGFSIEGLLKVDTLMRYNFQFFIDITSEVAIKRGSRRLASIGFEGTLSGMAPWKLTGKAKLKILFIKVTMPVYLQLGMATQIVIDAIDAQIPLLDALHDPGNWSSLDDDSGVVLLDIKREGVWMPSHSSIKVSQRVVPLDEKISRFGPSPLHEPQEFKIKSVLLGENHEQGQSNWQPVYEEFAPVLFEEIDLDESLKAPSFEKMQSGIHLSGDAVSKGASVDSGSDFEKIIIDDEYDESADEEMEKSGITISMSTVSAGEDVQVQDEYDFYRVARQPVGVESPKYTIADDELARDKDASSEGMNYFKARQERIKAQTKGIRRQVVRRYEVIR